MCGDQLSNYGDTKMIQILTFFSFLKELCEFQTDITNYMFPLVIQNVLN